jgi:hypothetical protein
MINIIILVEDKKDERDAAIEAIKKMHAPAIEMARAENLGLVMLQVPGTNDGTMIQIAGSLEVFEDKLKLVKGIIEVMGPKYRYGVITDLMFPARRNGIKEEPNGLVVLTECIKEKLPVVVCSDTDHHDVAWLNTVFPILGQVHPAGEIPVILDKKDWEKSVTLLADLWAK